MPAAGQGKAGAKPSSEPASAKAIEAALKRAQQNGVLNLQGKGLKVFPMDICIF